MSTTIPGLSLIVKAIEKGWHFIQYRNYRNFSWINRIVRIKGRDEFRSVYFHSLNQYAQTKDSAIIDLLRLDDTIGDFKNYFIKGDIQVLYNSVDHHWHTHNKMYRHRAYKLDVHRTIDDFLKVLAEKQLEFAPESTQRVLRELESNEQLLLHVADLIRKGNGLNLEPIDFKWFSRIEKIERLIPRRLFSLTKDMSLGRLNRKYVTLKEALDENVHLLVVAEAGCGKSSELLKLAYDLKTDNVIVAYFAMSEYSNRGIEEMLKLQLSRTMKQNLVVVLDGYDEIPVDNKSICRKKIGEFINENPEVRIILSVRSTFYEQDGEIQKFDPLKPYQLSGIDPRSIEFDDYLKSEFEVDPNSFRDALFASGMSDLITTPFYLKSLIRFFKSNGRLDVAKKEIFEEIIETLNGQDKKYVKAFENHAFEKIRLERALEKMSICMELMGKNYLTTEEIVELLDNKELELIPFSALLDKRITNEPWKFQNHQFQEFLVARQLSRMTFTQIKKLIVFEGSEILKPSWLNTLSLLLSILEKGILFTELLNWLLKADDELLIQCERDKLSNEIRQEVFEKIFHRYSNRKTWISTLKFKEHQFASFSANETCIPFLLDKISKGSNRFEILNAFYLFEYIDFRFWGELGEIEKVIVEAVETHLDDDTIINMGISSLVASKALTEEKFTVLFAKLSHRKNQNVRSSIYRAVHYLQIGDRHLDYLMEGMVILNNNSLPDRSDVGLIDESHNLSKCFSTIKEKESFLKLLRMYTDSSVSMFTNDLNDFIGVIIKSSICIYWVDPDWLDRIYEWFLHTCKGHLDGHRSYAKDFFLTTETVQTVFERLIRVSEIEEYDKFTGIVNLYAPDLFHCIEQAFIERAINVEFLQNLRNRMMCDKSIYLNQFETIVQVQLGVKVYPEVLWNYEDEKKKKEQESFDLLFEMDNLRKQFQKVFTLLEKDEISGHELYRLENHDPWEKNYWIPTVVHEELKELSRRKEIVTMNVIQGKVFKRWENFQIEKICKLISKSENLSVSNEQRSLVKMWFDRNLSLVDFKLAINIQNGFRPNLNAICLWTFYRYFDFRIQESTLLDLMNFDYVDIESKGYVGIEYLKRRVPTNKMVERAIENIRNRVGFQQIWKNNLDIIFEHDFVRGEYVIVEFIKDKKIDAAFRFDQLELYLEKKLNLDLLDELFAQEEDFFKWKVADILIKFDHVDELEKVLLKLLRGNVNDSQRAVYARYLIKLDNLEGLETWVEWSVQNYEHLHNEMDYVNFQNLSKLEQIEPLLGLLTFGFTNEKIIDKFQDPTRWAMDGLSSIGMRSSRNLKIVKSKLIDFVKENMGVLTNVQFLLPQIESVEYRFYMNQSQILSFSEVKLLMKKMNPSWSL